MDDSNEVQELLSRSYATPDYIDDADLEAGKTEDDAGYDVVIKFFLFRIGNVGN